MDLTMIAIFVGLILSGFIIGYPLGHAVARRESHWPSAVYPCPPPPPRMVRYDAILDAEILEERQ
jgi:hypothetical protein